MEQVTLFDGSQYQKGWQSFSHKIYHTLDAVSNSRLGKLRISPAHMIADLENPRDETPALIQGAAVHCFVFEPQKFDAQYLVKKKVNGATKEGKAYNLEMLSIAEANNQTIITEIDLAIAKSIRGTLEKHSYASVLLKEITHAERAGLWHDTVTNLPCKMLVDSHCAGINTFLDLKTTISASRRDFERSIYNYGYYRQAAMYINGAKELGEDIQHFIIIAVEKEPPFACSVYRIVEDAIKLGQKELADLMLLYHKCREQNHFPGYSEEVQTIGLPGWATKFIKEDIGEY